MSGMIGELGSCSYHLSTSIDVNDYQHGDGKAIHRVRCVYGSQDKMQVQAVGYTGHRGFWYNGNHLAYYSYDENNYVAIDAPADIMTTVDSLNKNCGIEFPAADFFYPTFTDNVLTYFDNLFFLGKSQIEGKSCFHILAASATIDLQVWIADDALNLPFKYVVTYKDQEPATQYQATFSDWQVNPDLPEAMFGFLPPPMARQIAILPKKPQ